MLLHKADLLLLCMVFIGIGIILEKFLQICRLNDPVYSCKVYTDTEEKCAHVDGPLCDFPDCDILKNYKERNRNEKA